MDTFICSAIELISSQGDTGVSVSSLWPKLNISISPSLKNAIWTNLLSIPSLEFQSQNISYNPNDPSIKSFEDAEKLDLKIVAKEQLKDPFVCLYDAQSSYANLSSQQRRALQQQRRALKRIAIAGTNGITQSQLAKEFGMEGKYFFYIVKSLESRGLIVRQPAVVRTKRHCSEGESNISSSVTNLIYLQRYATRLGSQQRFEISKDEQTVESLGNDNESAVSRYGFSGESVKEDVLIKDYLPAMKAICDKLEEADGKVLVVTDIKQDLGYTGTSSGHKAWRNICHRLKDASIVEEFDAKVNEKIEHCLRLLKPFLPKSFEPKTIGSGDNIDKEQQLKFGRRFQKTNQLIELPIEHQIYDMFDAEGSEGLTVMEVCERLGIDKKKNYSRLYNMFSRFGMHLQPENHKKTTVYRVWKSGNFNPESSNAFLSKSKTVHSEKKISNANVGDVDVPDGSAQTFLEHTTEVDFASPGKMNDREIASEISHGSLGDGKTNHLLLCPGDLQELLHEPSGTTSDAELGLVNTVMETNIPPSETTLPTLLKPLDFEVQTRPCQFFTADGARREKWILERLQDEKFILLPELLRWLVSLEKDKCTTMDRKTVVRMLKKLERQGHCKCVDINVPNVTNCGRNRKITVVRCPSVSLSRELVSEIHDRHRSFEMQSRGRGSSRCKNNESVPVLNGVQRTQNRKGSDAKAVRSEAMRANGFVLAKMVRAKLLHRFLWGYLSSSPDWDGTLSSGKQVHDQKHPCITSKLFSLEAAIKTIPLELFVQVAGSTQNFEDMIEKCKKGLCLADLPSQEYKCVMNTRATGRLSSIIDILRRLKLIRLVTNGHSDDRVKVTHASLTHALELKPYIEEPLSIVATSNFRSLDLRPRIRHDFILSNREAVDEYWQTLEYCYAASDPRAALHAFPGSAVHEVFLHRSWASVRVMTAYQRAELIKRIVKDNLNGKLTYKECEKIAKGLNLTIEQVLRVYYDKHQQRLNRFQGVLNANGEEYQPVKKRDSSSKKRKRSVVSRSKCTRVDSVTGQLDKKIVRLPNSTVNQFMEEQDRILASSREHDGPLPAYQENDHLENVEEPGPNKEHEECYSLISRHAFSKLKPTRQRRFSWTDKADRQLVVQYVRHRATLGPKFHRVDWALLPDLPAPPSICARRVSSLKRNTKFRKALMKLCNMLSKRYVKHLESNQNRLPNDNDCRLLVGCSSGKGLNRNFSIDAEYTKDSGFEGEPWDDFDNKDIKRAFEDVLRFKQMTKLEASKKVGSVSEEWSNINMHAEHDNLLGSELVSPASHSEDMQNLGGGQDKDSAQRPRCHDFHQKFIKLLNEGTSVGRQVHESLAVSNAIELFKLVFLSTSTAPELPNLLAETLRRYSECDLYAAFSYLRDKKFMIGGSSGQPFVLSQQFLHDVSKSPFPINTGKRAAKFSRWLHEREKDLMEGEIKLTADLQCGDILHLFSLVSSGELLISPCLPDEGVGEAEDSRSLKRKSEDTELCDGDKAKKLKSLTEGELVSRREKGFPGIKVSLHCSTISIANAIGLFRDGKTSTGELRGDDEFNTTLDLNFGSGSSYSDHMKEFNFDRTVPIAGMNESPWEAMAGYAEYLMLKPFGQEQVNVFNPEVFKVVYGAIQNSGDQGLSIGDVSHIVDMPGEKMPEHIIDVLQAFGRALKVNAYDSVRVVDALYRSKYFLTSMAGFCQDLKPLSLMKSLGRSDDDHLFIQPENHGSGGASSPREVSMNVEDLHKVTILNVPEEVDLPLNEIRTNYLNEGCTQGKVVSTGGKNEDETYKFSSDELCMPILPWINGDGTINSIVYNRLVRRVLGTVMQNPGILEDDIIRRMDVLNPQSCKKLLELMILDRHLIERKMYQTAYSGPPASLGSLLQNGYRESKLVCRKHFFANPMSASLL